MPINSDMMKKGQFLVVILSLLTLLSVSMYSQAPLTLPVDPAIVKGQLPNGLTYYLATNKCKTGRADIAIVQKVSTSDSARVQASIDSAFMKSQIFNARTPKEFFANNGIRNNESGWVRIQGDAIIYELNDLEINRGESIIDSTMLFIMSVVESTGYSPENQAIVVAGDINSGSLKSKLHMLSLVVAKKEKDYEGEPYVWEPSNGPKAKIIKTNAIPSIKAKLRTQRTPKEYMTTVLPKMSDQMKEILALALNSKLNAEFKARNIPVANIEIIKEGSDVTHDDECFSVEIKTDENHLPEVVSVFARITEEISNKGISRDEFILASRTLNLIQSDRVSSSIRSNGEYLNKCISSFLYNSSLCSIEERAKLYEKSNPFDHNQLYIFNNFASQLLGNKESIFLELRTKSDSYTEEGLLMAFFENSQPLKHEIVIDNSDTLNFYPSTSKTKLRRTRKEAMSSGVEWTFANGVKVVYKKLPTQGRLYYNLLLRGGYSQMKDLESGEGAYFSDVLKTYDVAGMTSESFKRLLLSNEIFMDVEVTDSDISVYGSTKSKKTGLLLKSLVAFANDRTLNKPAYEYYLSSEDLDLRSQEGTYIDRLSEIDSIMVPQNRYSSYKREHALRTDTQERAFEFFNRKFSRINDGVIIIIGDMYEDDLKKMLSKYLGAFKSGNAFMPMGEVINFQPTSGWLTYNLEGEKQSADVAMSTALSLTSENYFAANLASQVIISAVSSVLAKKGMYATCHKSYQIFPHDRFSILLSACNVGGYVGVENRRNSIDAGMQIRQTLEYLSQNPISDNILGVYKKQLISEINSKQQDPFYWLDMITIRYSQSKDLHTDYTQKINAVTPDKVKTIISELNNGSKLEYIITEK